MGDAFLLAMDIRRRAPAIRSGSLTFWGKWFGRPMDNIHSVVGCIGFSDLDLLILLFDEGERLWIWNAEGVEANPDQLRIANARRVRWEWYSYGQPPTPDTLGFVEYEVTGGRLIGRGSETYPGAVNEEAPVLPAVEIH